MCCLLDASQPNKLACVKQGSYDDRVLLRTYDGENCSIARALEIVGERWTLLILRDAVLGSTRFEEFQESLGIASNVLTNRLKLLCDEGVLERVSDEARPRRPKYVLTDKGCELGPALIVLMKWGDRHYPNPAGPPRLARHIACGGDIGSDLRCERCGETVGPGDIDLAPGPGLAVGRKR